MKSLFCYSLRNPFLYQLLKSLEKPSQMPATSHVVLQLVADSCDDVTAGERRWH